MIGVEWGGRTYDVDLSGYNGRELHDLEERTGETWRRTFLLLVNLAPDSVRAPFWLTDRRTNPDLKWSDYDGPPMTLLLPHLTAVRGAVETLGKAIIAAQPATSGSDDSPSEESDPPSSTGSPATTSP